jgi:replication factor C small subunit
MAEHTIWVEKYRPKDLSTYVGNPDIVDSFRRYIEANDIPHLLLHSAKPGTGKTTAAKLLANQINADVLYINASYENKIDTIREKIVSFSSTLGFEPLKIVILDEADYITAAGQAALRNVMEQFSKSTRFILTCNYVERLIEPVVSRCQVFHIVPPSKAQIAMRLMKILVAEGVAASPPDIAVIVTKTYPDIRKAIQLCQQFSKDGVLTVPQKITTQAGYIDAVVDGLTNGLGSKQLRQIIADSGVTRFEELFTELFRTVETWSKSPADDILTLANYAHRDALIVDKELNVAAMFVTLCEKR